MKTIIVTGYGVRIRFRKGVFVIEKKGDPPRTFSPVDVDQIVITTSGVSISSRALRACARLGVDLVVLDHRGDVVARLVPMYINMTVETRRLQYEAYLDKRGLDIAKWVLASKLANQAETLRYLAKSRRRSRVSDTLRDHASKIEQKALAVELVRGVQLTDKIRQELMSIEAIAARYYWDALREVIPPKLGFPGRDPDSADIVNLSLNYMYGLLKITCMRALMLLNIDPFAGYLHVDKSGRPSMVLDFMEIFRPLVDKTLVLYLNRNLDKIGNVLEGLRLRPEYRGELVKLFVTLARSTVRVSSEAICLETAIHRASKMLRDYLHGRGVLRTFHILLC